MEQAPGANAMLAVRSSWRFRLQLRAAAALLAAGICTPSSAATIVYTLSGAATAQFSIEEEPRPDQVYAHAFRLNLVQGSFSGQKALFDKLLFYASADLGGVGATLSDGTQLAFSTAGQQLFTGSLAAPVMRIGTFPLSRYGASDNLGGQYILTASSASGKNTMPLGQPNDSLGGATRGRGPSLPSGSFSDPASSGVGAVPEPTTWAMTLVGFGAVGYSMRRKSNSHSRCQAV